MATVSDLPAEVNAWLDYWNARPWPILQRTREQLLLLLHRAERIKSDQVVEVVLADPLLCAQVLKLVNQRQKSSLAADVITMESAIMLYGATAFLERFSRGVTVEDLLQSPLVAAVRSEIDQTLMMARLARDLANLRTDARLEEIYLAAGLARLPRLLKLIASADTAAPRESCSALMLIEGWQLPEALRKLNDFSSEMSARVALQAAVVQGVPALSYGWWQPEPRGAIETIAGVLGRSVEEVWALIRSRLLAAARQPYVAPHWPAARWLPMLPGDWPRQKRASVAASVSAADILQQSMQALQQAEQQGARTNQVMQLAFKALINGLGMRRVMLSLLDNDQITLKARFTHCAATDDPLRTFLLTLDPPHLITKLMVKQQSMWLNSQTRSGLIGKLPPVFLRQAGEGDFFAMSLFVGSRPVGLIYADRAPEQPLDDQAYRHFKQVCTLVSKALAARAA